MTQKKIILATSFKNFDNETNSKIQHLFLDSLEKQKYENFELLVCLFDQPQIIDELKNYKFRKKFINCKLTDEAKKIGASFSFYSWINNSIEYAINSNSDIYVYCFSDYIFEENFLHTLNKKIHDGVMAISYPVKKIRINDLDKNLQYDHKNEKYIKNEFGLNPNIYVNENFFISTNDLKRPHVKKIFNNFETLQGVNFAQLFGTIAPTKLNLYCLTKQTCIYNDYKEALTQKNHSAHFKNKTDLSHDLYKQFKKHTVPKRKLFYGPFRKLNNIREYNLIGSFKSKIIFLCWFYFTIIKQVLSTNYLESYWFFKRRKATFL